MPIPVLSSADAITPRKLLRDEAYDRISSAIVRGEFKPGEKLTDTVIAQWLGISRTPVREALARLERSGLVRTVPGRITIVSSIDPKTTNHAVLVAEALHTLAVREAAIHITDEDVQQMLLANKQLQQALEQSDAGQAIEADDAFHQVAIHRVDNPTLVNALEQVMPLLRRAEYFHFDSLLTPDSVEQHAKIVAALKDHDAQRAAEASRENWLTLSE